MENKTHFSNGGYVVYHLTGRQQIDYSLATRTMAFDISKLGWSEEIFRTADIDMSLMSQPVPTGTLAGSVTDKTVEKTGLNKDTKIISISHDQVAAAVGAGVFDGSVAVDGAGTVECLTPIYDQMPDIDVCINDIIRCTLCDSRKICGLCVFLYRWGFVQWCVDNITKEEKKLAKEQGISGK